jgi:hypothetical protein
MGNFFVGFRVRMQPQTMNAPTIAQKIQSGICCTVVFSVAQHDTSHYKDLRIKSYVSSNFRLVRKPRARYV